VSKTKSAIINTTPTFANRSKKSTKPELKTVPDEVAEIPVEERATLLPDPTGYKILIALPAPEEMTAGGIVKSSDTVRAEQISSVTGLVIKLGPDAYADKKRFSKPYCKEGDFVMFRAYSGTRFTVYGEEFRILNDDSVEATVDDPRGIAKV
jgi:co-chaperonin GroES (HSP10)